MFYREIFIKHLSGASLMKTGKNITPVRTAVIYAFFGILWILGSDISLVKRCRAEPAFDYCPIFVTGGQNPETIPDTIAAGSLLIGSGFDLILKGMQDDVTCDQVTERLKIYLDVTKDSRAKYWPETVSDSILNNSEWLNNLSHYHPFTQDTGE